MVIGEVESWFGLESFELIKLTFMCSMEEFSLLDDIETRSLIRISDHMMVLLVRNSPKWIIMLDLIEQGLLRNIFSIKTRILKRDRRATLPHISADFIDGESTSVSVRTVQRTVINMGSQSRRSTRVPLLTVRHKALLLSWARQHYHWTIGDWKHVSWSHESRFQLYRTDARVRVWRHH
ncbi:hypothetical protein AVEN_242625-1 [Araneus ventricosus]|uniref:Transposase Tc1-like domain-containing protein n=1 Tax=Araneus ventricosus TaxID=182803 RepID=A0A4Y2V1H3_ARAVE|nr:hypothetical protein AVEN_242625-1 [Araneus ventricosus]